MTAAPSVVEPYRSRSRWNLNWVALKEASRAAISSRSFFAGSGDIRSNFGGSSSAGSECPICSLSSIGTICVGAVSSACAPLTPFTNARVSAIKRSRSCIQPITRPHPYNPDGTVPAEMKFWQSFLDLPALECLTPQPKQVEPRRLGRLFHDLEPGVLEIEQRALSRSRAPNKFVGDALSPFIAVCIRRDLLRRNPGPRSYW